MAFGPEFTLRGFFRPQSDSDGPSTIDLHVHWKHCRRVFRRTNHGVLPPTEDEPIGPSRSSQFCFSFQPLSEFRQQIWISIASLNFPVALSNFLYQSITSFAIDFTAERPTRLSPSFMILADINFVQKLCVNYTLRPVELIRPRQLGAAGFADETFILGTSTDGRSGAGVDSDAFADETFIPGTSTDGRSGARGRQQRFRGRNFHALAEIDEDKDAGIEMLKRIKLGKWVVGGGEEVTCSVCLEEFSEGQEVMTMECKHTYHERCILTWLNRNQTCPLCRRPIKTSPLLNTGSLVHSPIISLN